jgi:hypothetical protein
MRDVHRSYEYLIITLTYRKNHDHSNFDCEEHGAKS